MNYRQQLIFRLDLVIEDINKARFTAFENSNEISKNANEIMLDLNEILNQTNLLRIKLIKESI